MRTVKEISEITGISVRTLHYYDQIGLFCPTEVTESGYRLYDDQSLEMLQQILFFRELGFKLKEIKKIINSSNFDRLAALKNHRNLLKIKKVRLEKLIQLTNKILRGENDMSFKEFDKTDFEKAQKKYEKEVKDKFGNTSAYKENKEKTSKYQKEDWNRINSEAESIYKKFSENMSKNISDESVQKLVKEWQDYITKNFYNCTDEILSGLGEMYIADERFMGNIDKHKKGLAKFMSDAIKFYCSKR